MILRLVWENVCFRPLRTLLSVLLIGVPVMLILTLVGVSQGFMDASQERSRGVGADVVIRPPHSSLTSGSGATMPQAMVTKLGQQPHVVLAQGVVQALTNKMFNLLTGIDYTEFKKMSGGFSFVQGDDAHAFVNPNDMVVDTDYAKEAKLHVGSTVTILNNNWHISAIVDTGKMSHIFVPLAVLQDLQNAENHVSMIYLKLDDPKNAEAVVDALKHIHGLEDYEIYSMQDVIDLTSVDKIPVVGIFINVIIGIGIFTGLIVVSLSMYMAVLQRTREIGILKSLGATKGFVMSLILWEACAMGIGGTIVGIGLSYASRIVLHQFAAASLPQAIVPLWWPRVLGIALGSALLGALYPGMIAVAQDPIEALAYE
ncbi:MAG TPA: ABC transporter permease [Bryobacteraceae bacterium]|jgi:putative ABC transport system permease protein